MVRSRTLGLLIAVTLLGCVGAEAPIQVDTPSESNDTVGLETGDCGDGLIQPDEVCDGSNVGGVSCELLGYGVGELSCGGDCQDFNTSACELPTCGDGLVQPGEACEGDNLNGWTCELLGFAGGELQCNEDCGLEQSACYLPESCDCPDSWLSDGLCDDSCNAIACGYDGGDCCPSTCDGNYCGNWGWSCVDPSACESTGECEPAPEEDDPWSSWDNNDSECAEYWIGDGWCDPSNNTELCEWDGGDCCPSTCPEEASYMCGEFPWDCLDPGACENTGECEPAPEYEDPWDGWGDTNDSNGCSPSWLGDGWCDPGNNNALCEWDGGDCCASTCPEDSPMPCGSIGWDCQDPSACENTGECEEPDDNAMWGSNGQWPETEDECVEAWNDNGWCDLGNNNEACHFDGGDCCASTCSGCSEFVEWLGDNLCLDPQACENSASGCL